MPMSRILVLGLLVCAALPAEELDRVWLTDGSMVTGHWNADSHILTTDRGTQRIEPAQISRIDSITVDAVSPTPAQPASNVVTLTMKDGRKLTGIYDETTGVLAMGAAKVTVDPSTVAARETVDADTANDAAGDAKVIDITKPVTIEYSSACPGLPGIRNALTWRMLMSSESLAFGTAQPLPGAVATVPYWMARPVSQALLTSKLTPAQVEWLTAWKAAVVRWDGLLAKRRKAQAAVTSTSARLEDARADLRAPYAKTAPTSTSVALGASAPIPAHRHLPDQVGTAPGSTDRTSVVQQAAQPQPTVVTTPPASSSTNEVEAARRRAKFDQASADYKDAVAAAQAVNRETQLDLDIVLRQDLVPLWTRGQMLLGATPVTAPGTVVSPPSAPAVPPKPGDPVRRLGRPADQAQQ